MIRHLAAFAFSLCVFSPAVAQSSGWDSVERLPSDQLIRVGRLHGGQTCNFVMANDDTLVCEQRRTIIIVPVSRRIVFSRNDVQSIRLSRQGVSTLAGATIGAGAGAGIGAGIDASAKSQMEEGHVVTSPTSGDVLSARLPLTRCRSLLLRPAAETRPHACQRQPGPGGGQV